MSRNANELQGVSQLGAAKTAYPTDYAPQLLETFANKHPDNDYFVKFNCPEFTSLCPVTGQPDFATIYISYVPNKLMVESKSLKLYLFSFRNHGDFHEDCINIIMKDLRNLLQPKYIEVWGKFLPRGGLSIDPYCNWGQPGTRWEKAAADRLLWHDMYPEAVNNRYPAKTACRKWRVSAVYAQPRRRCSPAFPPLSATWRPDVYRHFYPAQKRNWPK